MKASQPEEGNPMDPFLPAPQPKRWRREVYAAVLALPFAAMEFWAITVLVSTGQWAGPGALAFVLVIAGAALAAVLGLCWLWRLGREPGIYPIDMGPPARGGSAVPPARYP
jgi:hypothetical protein